MENKHKSVYPQISSNTNSQHQLSEVFTDYENVGLTKREYFAGLFMASLITNPDSSNPRLDIIAGKSISAADQLLKCLEK
ncbi:hypothetical protein [uncultured Chryseobacterium sp.]|uniref:hypothetical protein n=1 Tax=uncultured Chryseobacterium sp. TaxID=259322 RepID=UPI0025DF0B59|nr:hypothetical protein [uncultured Chryseobacterium sp.]